MRRAGGKTPIISSIDTGGMVLCRFSCLFVLLIHIAKWKNNTQPFLGEPTRHGNTWATFVLFIVNPTFLTHKKVYNFFVQWVYCNTPHHPRTMISVFPLRIRFCRVDKVAGQSSGGLRLCVPTPNSKTNDVIVSFQHTDHYKELTKYPTSTTSNKFCGERASMYFTSGHRTSCLICYCTERQRDREEIEKRHDRDWVTLVYVFYNNCHSSRSFFFILFLLQDKSLKLCYSVYRMISSETHIKMVHAL